MPDSATTSSDARSFFVLFMVALLLSAAVVFVNAMYGHVPLLGSLPGDISIVLGTMPVRLPISSCILVSGVLTGVASIVSLLQRNPPDEHARD